MTQPATQDESFDYVVIGAGGCIAASELCADPAIKVCVLEAGPSDNHLVIHVPAGFVHMLGNPNYTWQFTNDTGCPHQWPPHHTHPGAHPGRFHLAQRHGGQSWPAPRFRWLGRSRQYRLELCRFAALLPQARTPPRRRPGIQGHRRPARHQRYALARSRNHRSAARAFLKPAAQNGNLSVRTQAAATRILFEGRHAAGVQYRQGGTLHTVKARREIILSGGTINTARLLQISGIGDPQWLGDLGVPVVHALPGVGRNFRDQYLLNVCADGKGFVSINQHATGARLWWQVARWMISLPSILELTPPLVNWFVDSGADAGHADIQGIFVSASKRFGGGQKLDPGNGMTCGLWQHRPESVGFVRAKSTDIAEQPIIQPNYLDEAADRRVAIAAGRKARALLTSPQMVPFYVKETRPGADVQTDDEWLSYFENTGTSAYHPVGTASMGPSDDPASVVDHRLSVHGVTGLRVVDASVMPRIISANTQTTTMMIGLKAAAMIREDWRSNVES